jgi:hypothetical protein
LRLNEREVEEVNKKRDDELENRYKTDSRRR